MQLSGGRSLGSRCNPAFSVPLDRRAKTRRSSQNTVVLVCCLGSAESTRTTSRFCRPTVADRRHCCSAHHFPVPAERFLAGFPSPVAYLGFKEAGQRVCVCGKARDRETQRGRERDGGGGGGGNSIKQCVSEANVNRTHSVVPTGDAGGGAMLRSSVPMGGGGSHVMVSLDSREERPADQQNWIALQDGGMHLRTEMSNPLLSVYEVNLHRTAVEGERGAGIEVI